ncbi:MAG: hypothetical protein IKP68_08755 [Clostridia bacterium]|nr:hypothetical protein [Clostridia bacterium]
MGLFGKKKDENNVRFRREMAKKIVKHRLRYVSERVGDTDTIVSKGGEMHIKDGVFYISSGIEYGSATVFSCEVDKLKSSELLSLEGAILEGPDREHDDILRKIIVYYVYYR